MTRSDKSITEKSKRTSVKEDVCDWQGYYLKFSDMNTNSTGVSEHYFYLLLLGDVVKLREVKLSTETAAMEQNDVYVLTCQVEERSEQFKLSPD